MKNKFFINLSILFITIVITLFIVEIIIRIFLPQKLIYYNNNLWKPHDGLGWERFSNIDIQLNPGGAGLVRFITDNDGYRIGIQDKKINNYDYNVLILGDSFLEAFQVEYEKTIPHILQSEIKIKKNASIKFYNTAVSGYNPNHYLIISKNFLKKQNVDLVLVFLYSANDLVDFEQTYFSPKLESYPSKFRFPKEFSYKEFINALLLPLNDFLETRFHLFILFKTSFETTLSKLGLTHYLLEEVFFSNEKSENRAKITAKICKKIDKVFRDQDIKTKFIILPAAYQVNDKLLNNYLKGFRIDKNKIDILNPNKLLNNEFKKINLVLHDPFLEFLKLNKQGINTHGKIDRHFNEVGHAITSDFVYKLIENEF